MKTQRPGEADFTPYGHSLSYDSMDELFARWSQMLEVLDDRGYWSSSPEVGVADSPIAALITSLSSLTTQACSNGVGWLLGVQFLDVVHNVQSQLSILSRRQATLNRSVARLLQNRSAEEMESIVAAARDARNIRSLWEEVDENSNQISQSTAAVAAANELAESTNARMALLARQADEDAIAISNDKASIQKSHSEVAELKKSAVEREAELEARVLEMNGALEDTKKLADTAYKSVEDALRKVRDQGLAKSFQDRSNSLQSERNLWGVVFGVAAVMLLAIAMIFSSELSSMTYEALLVNLLRRIGLAAPLVWVGWYAAKQVGRIARVQEDYEYKAASALAFQAYKEEAKLGGDPELENRLLGHAIQTFGENPVRLYEHHESESVSPVQAAIKELPPEKIAAILAAVGEQSLKTKFWPPGK